MSAGVGESLPYVFLEGSHTNTNILHLYRAMSELYRVLKPGASVAILDFNNSTDPTIDSVQAWFLQVIVWWPASPGVQTFTLLLKLF